MKFDVWWNIRSRGGGDLDASHRKIAEQAWMQAMTEAAGLCRNIKIIAGGSIQPVSAEQCALAIQDYLK